MPVRVTQFFKALKAQPDRFLLIHYSSQSLFDEGMDGLSPRITSIVAMHFASRQTTSFAIHAVAELLSISKDDVESSYDRIEKKLLEEFFGFVANNRDKVWIHWNMLNLTYGFEHLEHRSRYLGNGEPVSVPVENRLSLVDVLREKYGRAFAPDPKMKNLMLLNGPLPAQFLTGAEEAEAFKSRGFIRMNSSTIAKVDFFRHAIVLAQSGRLHTAGKGWGVHVDRLLESRTAKGMALLAGGVGGLVGLWQALLWLRGLS